MFCFKHIIIILFLFFIKNAYAHESNLHKYPNIIESGKKYAQKILKEDLTIDLQNLQKPILYIPQHECEKQLTLPAREVDCAGAKKRDNIAYNHPEENPINMIGGIHSEVISNCSLSNLEKQSVFFSDKFDNTIAPKAWFTWRHSWGMSNRLQDYHFTKNKNQFDSLTYLKDNLVQAAEKGYLTKAPNCDYWGKETKSEIDKICMVGPGQHGEIDGWDATVNYFIWGELSIFLETHITLLKEDLYSEKEKKIVHDWLEKMVWFIERGPGNGTLSKKHKYMPIEDPPNHHTISKILVYLLWGIADQNAEYFTAGVRGFESAYSIIREDGSLLTEHKPSDKSKKTCLKKGPEIIGCGHGGFQSFDRGNLTSRFIVLMALVLENQGFDIKKNFPKIEKIIQFTHLSIEDPLNKQFSKIWGQYTLEEYKIWNSLRYQSKDDSNPPMPHNNLGYLFLWDIYYGDSYSDVVPDYINQKAVTEFGVLDATCLSKK